MIKIGKYATAAIAGALLDYQWRRRVFAGRSAGGVWPFIPRISQKKRRLNARRAA